MENDDSKYLINVTHEFKAPISNLKLIIETLYEYNETISSYKRKEILELAWKETERLREIVIQFLNIKKNLNSLEGLLKKDYFPCFLEKIFLPYETLFFYKNSSVYFSIYGCNESGFAMLNHSLYFQILLNLLENASKFIKNNGWVLLEMDIFTSLSLSSFLYVRLGRSSVSDNGVGFKNKLMISIPLEGILLNVKKDKFGVEIVKNLLSFHKSSLIIITYPERGSKLFFNISFIDEL
jgi:two-component system phosphate regulon sensor histidine kinase PhoR